MNRMLTRPWFGPGAGTLLYLCGFNDELLHVIGEGWLKLGRLPQTLIVVVLLLLIAWLVNDRLSERRSAYRTAVRASSLDTRDSALSRSPSGVTTPT